MSASSTLVVELSLSAKGLLNLPANIAENDFTFIVGTERYKCPKFIAGLLSPRIAALQAGDPTLQEFIIPTPDPDMILKIFLVLAKASVCIFV
jgi:hypothetical protein